jgi:hypothetical protein
LVNGDNVIVGRLAQRCELPAGDVVSVTVTAIVSRSKAQAEPAYRRLCRVDDWKWFARSDVSLRIRRKLGPAERSRAVVDSV